MNNADVKDPFYKCLAANRADIFWKKHTKGKPTGGEVYSESFMELIQMMMQYDSVHRPSLMEIFSHEWTQGDTATDEEI